MPDNGERPTRSSATPFDLALEAASSPGEKERLRDLRLRLNVPVESPEWAMYAITVAPLLGFEAQITENGKTATVETARAMDEALAKIAGVADGFERTLTKTVRSEVVSALKTVKSAVDPRRDRWHWPAQLAAITGALLLLAVGSLSGAVAQYALDARRLPRAAFHVPWLATAQAAVATWPVVPFVVATAMLLAVVIVLGVRKSGPVSHKIFP